MNRRLLSISMSLWMLGGLLASPSVAQPPDEPYPHLARRLEAAKGGRLEASGIRFRSQQAVFVHSWDQGYLELELRPHLSTEDFDAKVTIHGLAGSSGTLDTLDFNLDASATIDSVVVNGVVRNWTRATDPVLGDQSLVNVDVADMGIASFESFVLTVAYTGVMNSGSGGLLLAEPPFSSSKQDAVLYSMAEPYDGRRWLACYDLPGDKFDSTQVTVILPSNREVLSNGYLEADSVWFDGQDSLRATTWFNPDPIASYLINIAAADYEAFDAGTAGANNTPVSFWVYPGTHYDFLMHEIYSSDKVIYDFGRTGMMIEMMEHFFVPYPFNKYAQVMVPMGGAMEHQTSTSMSDGWVGDGNRENESVIAHELGHQWWGDYVGPQTFKDIWLNEGFASYMEALWKEYQQGSLGLAMVAFQGNAMHQDDAWAFPIYDPPPGEMFSTTVYDKGACILHMLRWTIGDSAFFAGMRYYAQNHAYGIATTAEFEEDMESVSGMNLQPFFDQWVYGSGYPKYRLNDWWKQQQPDGTWDVFVDVSQEQNPSWGPFNTPLPITARHEYSLTLDTTLAAQIDPVRRDTVFITGIAFEPTRLQFNRDHWLMCRYTSELAGVEEDQQAVLPDRFDVSHAWPNPFNGSTEFTVSLVRTGDLHVRVVNLLGQQVAELASSVYSPGTHRFVWRPDPGLSSGFYVLQVRTAEGTVVRRVTLLR